MIAILLLRLSVPVLAVAVVGAGDVGVGGVAVVAVVVVAVVGVGVVGVVAKQTSTMARQHRSARGGGRRAMVCC